MFHTPEGVINETDFQEFVTLLKKALSRLIDRNEGLIQENIRLRKLLARREPEHGADGGQGDSSSSSSGRDPEDLDDSP